MTLLSSASLLSLHTPGTGRNNIVKWGLSNLTLHSSYLVKTDDFQEISKTKNDNVFFLSSFSLKRKCVHVFMHT